VRAKTWLRGLEAPPTPKKNHPRGQLADRPGRRNSHNSDNGARLRAHNARAHSLPRRTPAPSCARSRLQSRLEATKGRPPAGHLNATTCSSCWPLAAPGSSTIEKPPGPPCAGLQPAQPPPPPPGQLDTWASRQLALPPQRWKGWPGQDTRRADEHASATRARACA